MINELISSVLQVLVFSLIPFLVFLIQKKTVRGFFDWIGIKKTTMKANLMAVATSGVFIVSGIGLAVFSEEIKSILVDPNSVSGRIKAMGLSGESIAILLMLAWIKTSLSEEIFFRGFVAKRLISVIGYQKGNIIQALIFAIIHVLLFYLITQASVAFLVFIFFLSGMAGYLIVIIKEKYGNGSIIPGWIAHGSGNMVSYFLIAFVI